MQNQQNINVGEGINPNKECLTAERLKQFPGLENLTNEEAETMLLSIRMFSKVIVTLNPAESEETEYINYKNAA